MKYVVANLETGTARPNVYDDPERAMFLMDELNEEHGDGYRIYELREFPLREMNEAWREGH